MYTYLVFVIFLQLLVCNLPPGFPIYFKKPDMIWKHDRFLDTKKVIFHNLMIMCLFSLITAWNLLNISNTHLSFFVLRCQATYYLGEYSAFQLGLLKVLEKSEIN